MITWLAPDDPPDRFPPHEAALRDPSGLLAAGGDLKPERLMAAYARGIFPWYSPGQPVLWWSPDPREVLWPHEFHRSRSLTRAVRARGFSLHEDRDFSAVVSACAAPRSRSPGTWITPEMKAAYCLLHARGVAHFSPFGVRSAARVSIKGGKVRMRVALPAPFMQNSRPNGRAAQHAQRRRHTNGR